MFLVVIENMLHALDARVLLRRKVLLHGSLVPVEDAADKGRDEKGTGLGARDGLHEREHQRQVAVDAVLRLQDVRGLDPFPRRGDLDEDALFADADGFVELVRVGVVSAREGCLGVWYVGYGTDLNNV